MRYLVLLSRILVGLLFIVSGLIKANDPLGFSYKLEEYFSVFGMDWMAPMALSLSILISVSEIILGVATLLGTKMKPVTWSLLGMIVFFTFLTFYSAYFNKVTDCGCFGDALKLTPWESFSKDIFLLVFILILFFNRNKIKSVFSDNLKKDWASVGLTTVLSFSFAFYCLWHLPVKDFRPYAIGKSIPEQMKLPPNAKPYIYETVLLYKNMQSNEVKELSSDEYMANWAVYDESNGWKHMDTKNKEVQKGDDAKIKDFKIEGYDGNDYTMDILDDPDYVLLLVAYDIKKADVKGLKKFSAFAEEANKNGLSVLGLSASSETTVEEIRHEVQAPYNFYSADAITLKTMIRSNPGLILLKKGVVLDMWHHNDFPSFAEFKAKHLK